MNTKDTVLWNLMSCILARYYKGLVKALSLYQVENSWLHK